MKLIPPAINFVQEISDKFNLHWGDESTIILMAGFLDSLPDEYRLMFMEHAEICAREEVEQINEIYAENP
jgi:hypothetical protein